MVICCSANGKLIEVLTGRSQALSYFVLKIKGVHGAMFFRPVFFLAHSVSLQVHRVRLEDLTRQKENTQFCDQNELTYTQYGKARTRNFRLKHPGRHYLGVHIIIDESCRSRHPP